MRRTPLWSVLALLCACDARLSDAPRDGAGGGDARTDGALDALAYGPWSRPGKVLEAATPATEDDVTLSSDALEMIFAVADTGGKDLYYTQRTSLTAPWSPSEKLPIDTTGNSEETPRFSADDKTLYFASDRAGNGTLDIYALSRPEVGKNTWDAQLRSIGAVNTTTDVEKWYMPCGTDHYVLVRSTSLGTTDLFEGTLGAGMPSPIKDLNSDAT